jgi:hypothetical protein
MKNRFGSEIRSYGICGGQNGTAAGFLRVLRVPLPLTVAERSKACTVFDRSEAGIVGSNPLMAWTFSVCVCVCVCVLCVCVCVFFCVCVQVEALRRADHPPKES